MKKGRNDRAAAILRRVYMNNESKVDEVLQDVQASLKATEGPGFGDTITALFNRKIIERYCV